tara:strand:- start:1933 stop:4989 length:3057 start_codon:yes stop_codon:yes gene_type:complete
MLYTIKLYKYLITILLITTSSSFSQTKIKKEGKYINREVYDRAQELFNIGDSLFYNTKQEALSIQYLTKSLNLFQSIKDSLNINKANYSLGIAYNYIGKQKKAIHHLKKTLSTKDVYRIMWSYYHLSDSYYFDSKIDSCIYYLNKSYQLAKKQNESDLIKIIIDDYYSIYTYDIVDIEKVIHFLNESADFFAGTEPYITATAFHDIGSLHYDDEKYTEAINAYEKSKKIWVKYIPSYQDSIEYFNLLTLLSATYNSVGNYDSLEAIQTSINSVGISKNLNTLDKRIKLDMIYDFYTSVGRDPEVILDQYIDLRKEILNKINSSKYNLSNMDLARLFQELAYTFKFSSDDKEKALSYLEKSIKYFESIDTTNLQNKSLIYDSNLNKEDVLFQLMSTRISLAIYLHEEMKDIEYSNNVLMKNINYYDKITGSDKSYVEGLYIASLGNLGTNSLDINEYDKAIEYFELTSSLQKENSEFYADDMFWLAVAYYNKMNYKKSIEYFKKELKINKKLKLTEEMLLSYYNIGESYFMDKKINNSISYIDSAINIIDKISNSLDNKNKVNLLNKHISTIQLQSYNYFITDQNLKLIELIESYRSLILKEKLTLNNSKSDYQINTLQSLLSEDECVLLFVNVNMSDLYSNMENPDIIHPILIYIDNNTIISKKINVPKNSITKTTLDRTLEFEIKYLINNSILQKSNIADIHQKKFYKNIFNSVEHLIENKKKLNILLDGSLNNLPLEILIDNNGDYLINSFEINYISSLEIFYNKRRKTNNKLKSPSILAIGSPKMPESINKINNYINDNNVHGSIVSKINANKNISEELSFLGYSDWRELPGALDEISNISKQFNNVKALTGSNATELSVKILNDINHYDIIHFATHSMIIRDIPEASSIVLSPSNKSDDDGYLNIKEISKLNIKSSFINLSSCESGTGEIISGQGVNNFIQAFEYAGADAVLVSLWPIDDHSTSVFMNSFYKKIYNGKIYDKALAQVKREFIAGRYGEEYKKPYYWAPFVYYGK